MSADFMPVEIIWAVVTYPKGYCKAAHDGDWDFVTWGSYGQWYSSNYIRKTTMRHSDFNRPIYIKAKDRVRTCL